MEPDKKPSSVEVMAKWDLNQDQEITRGEFEKNEKVLKLSPEARREHFDRLDKDGNGKIVLMELKMIRRDHRIGGGRNRGRLSLGDFDQDGVVSFSEFEQIGYVRRLPKKRREKNFKRLDRNRNGVLDPLDDPKVGLDFFRPLPLVFLPGLDQDGDRRLSYEEFVNSPGIIPLPEKTRRKIFAFIDTDKDEMLKPRELKIFRGEDPNKWKKKGGAGDRGSEKVKK